jgi:hypothetical protein
LITSDATGWDPNQAKYASADAMGGPWSALRNLGDGTTYDTQSTYVISVTGARRSAREHLTRARVLPSVRLLRSERVTFGSWRSVKSIIARGQMSRSSICPAVDVDR